MSFGQPQLSSSMRAHTTSMASQPSQRGLLGDITNMVHASRTSSKAPPKHTLAATGRAVLQGSKPKLLIQEENFSAMFERDAHDPQRASEYAADVFASLLDKERAFLPKPDYMDAQADLNGKMRAILIDWLVEVHMKYRLRPETMFLAVNIIDRYLSVRPVRRNKLQLLGVTAMFIAAKFEEIDPPKVKDFSYITEHTYSKKEILNMECSVLFALGYQISVPTAAHMLNRLQQANGCDAVHRSFVQYALELSLLDMKNMRYPPSMVVSAAVMMSNEYLGRQLVWPPAMVHHSRYSEATLRPCASDLQLLLATAQTASLQAVRRKYRLDLYHGVANLAPSVPRH